MTITVTPADITPLTTPSPTETHYILNGTFASLHLTNAVFPANTVWDCHAAHFTNAKFTSTSNITLLDATFEGVTSDTSTPLHSLIIPGLWLNLCTNITVRGGTISGKGWGVRVDGGSIPSANIVFSELTSTGESLAYGMVIGGLDGFTISAVSLPNIIVDNFQLNKCRNGVFEAVTCIGNSSLDTAQHRDAIQLVGECHDIRIASLVVRRYCQGVGSYSKPDPTVPSTHDIHLLNCDIQTGNVRAISPDDGSHGWIVEDCMVSTLPTSPYQSLIMGQSMIEFRGHSTVAAYTDPSGRVYPAIFYP